jgi:hypothetical protein
MELIVMAMHFGCFIGTGRAVCKICNKKINKQEWQVSASTGWRDSGNVHLECLTNIAQGVHD